ncbi:Sulfotransfer_1 domain-containing protein [Durusdinium trenchii]|uniref:Sulfotransfer_1 domain-containing protein n=1 Tax=Durusdinium trenchii TaxID=1381693 RepID=A0ABP0QM03_9DINO
MARALVLGLVVALASAETVNDCIESKCRGCGGEQCQLCREDKNTISACVSSCMDTICEGCGGEQCQLCREDAKTIESCCSEQVLAIVTAEIDMCKAKGPCDGLYGAESLQCVWEESVKTCVETSCKGCAGEQCQLCRQDAGRIASCCDDHYHSVDPPQICKDSKEEAVTSCFDSKCRGCGGEQCQLCREDAKSECCTGAMRTPSCESSKALLP